MMLDLNLNYIITLKFYNGVIRLYLLVCDGRFLVTIVFSEYKGDFYLNESLVFFIPGKFSLKLASEKSYKIGCSFIIFLTVMVILWLLGRFYKAISSAY